MIASGEGGGVGAFVLHVLIIVIKFLAIATAVVVLTALVLLATALAGVHLVRRLRGHART